MVVNVARLARKRMRRGSDGIAAYVSAATWLRPQPGVDAVRLEPMTVRDAIDIGPAIGGAPRWVVFQLAPGERFGRDYYLAPGGQAYEVAAEHGFALPFAERLRRVIFLVVQAWAIDSRKLIARMAPAWVKALRAESDWQDVPVCFRGDAAIAGAVFGVVVREEFNNIGAIITLDGAAIGQVVAADIRE